MESVEGKDRPRPLSATEEVCCGVLGAGAWGPGFANWEQLQGVFARLGEEGSTADEVVQQIAPKPTIIPANERRRAPLPVKIAVETSSQALLASQLQAADVACVFGSGLGDTEITDYMCRVLTTEAKQLSPTKFHNSVHNAAAGYWTISSGCMRSANSIAAFHQTAGLCLMEAMTLCQLAQEPVLITVFDSKAHDVYRELFACDQHFAASLLICPAQMAVARQWVSLRMRAMTPVEADAQPELTSIENPHLRTLARSNPAAKILGLLGQIALCQRQLSDSETVLSVAPELGMTVNIRAIAR